ncbi:hypothetical protein PMX75_25630, partial [Enterocloster clostridioformis]|nr:hypothetical protein [Enterocloster clostridioformis]
MAIKNGKDYLYLIWKCTSNRRQYIVGQLTKNGQYEFQYGGEIKDAIKVGFKPLVSFEKLGNVYKCAKSGSTSSFASNTEVSIFPSSAIMAI